MCVWGGGGEDAGRLAGALQPDACRRRRCYRTPLPYPSPPARLPACLQVVVYNTAFDRAFPQMRFTVETQPGSAPFAVYISSCLRSNCTAAQRAPTAATAAMTATIGAGTAGDIVIGRTSPAYCTAPVNATSPCAYFLTFAPVCAPGAADACIADFTITANGFAQTVPFAMLDNQVTVIQGENIPGRSRQYYLHVKPGSGGASDTSLARMRMRIEACDTVLGYPTLYACEGGAAAADVQVSRALPAPPLSGRTRTTPSHNVQPPEVMNASRTNTRCFDPPKPGAGNYEVELNTQPNAPGGDGLARATITGSSALRYVSTTVYRLPNYAARYAAFPLSTFTLYLMPANAVWLTPPNWETAGAGAITVQAPVHGNASSPTGAMFVTWRPPAFMFDLGVANVTARRGLISYTVYLARG